MKFQHAILFSLSATTFCFGANVADIQTDMNHLTSNITTFTTALSNFDPSNLVSTGVPLVLAAEGILQAITDSTTDAEALPKPVSNPAGLISAVTPLGISIPKALKAIENAKSKFAAIPASGTVAVGGVGGILVSLQSMSQILANATIAALPASQQASLVKVRNAINTAFASTIGTYGADICSN
ncbi:hypothetical protein BDN70DRAFT_894599 [Pholiota conissans]|uniref:Uncharacterized protein n=1 Tax=Pholiota conissans TaxID=109636 RepID=A0A9P5Z394_9AGAR|nr:hypothetical protein BDN70DRAFT_894599 [Pholiota conissans]